ncbi:MAG: MFS transporter [Ferruginibacter sp.]
MIFSTVTLFRNAYTGLSRRIWLLGAVMLINRSGTMVLAFMTLYSTHLGFSIRQAGWVVAIYGMGSIIGALLGGKISDRFGFYYTQVFALFCGGILFVILGQMRSYESICICAFFLSMVNESFRPANATAIAHYSTPKNRTQSYSLVRLAINIGWGVGSALGGFLASIDYSLLFWVDGATSITAAVVLLLILPKVSLLQQKTPSPDKVVPEKISPYKDRHFLFFCLFTFFFAICFFQLFTTIPLYFKEKLLLNEFWIGMIMAGNGIFIALFEMVIVYKLEGRHKYLLLMFYGSVLMALSFMILNFTALPGLIVAVLFVLIITLSEIIAMPFMNSWYISRTSDVNRGQYAGMYTISWSAAQVIGSSAGAFLAFRYGFSNLWILVFGLSLSAGAGYFWLKRKAKASFI